MFELVKILAWADTISETKDGVKTTKKVLYKADGTEVVIQTTSIVVAEEVEKITQQIAELTAVKNALI